MIDIQPQIHTFEKACRGEEVRSGLIGALNATNNALVNCGEPDPYQAFRNLFWTGQNPYNGSLIFRDSVIQNDPCPVTSRALYNRIGPISSLL